MALALPLLLAALQGAAPAQPPYHYCEVSRTVPFGNVTVLQYVSAAGTSEPPVTTWFAERRGGGTVLLASWHTRAEMADTGEGGSIYFGFRPADRTAPYRLEIAPFGGGAASGPPLRSELHRPSGGGFVSLRVRWGPVVALLAGGADLEARVVRGDGSVVRRDRIDAAELGRALRLAGEIQPEFEAVVANHRERCRPTSSNGR